MKEKIFNVSILIFSVLLVICPYETKALSILSNLDNITTYEYLDDGSYFVTSITEDHINRASGTKTGHKTQYYCDSMVTNYGLSVYLVPSLTQVLQVNVRRPL